MSAAQNLMIYAQNQKSNKAGNMLTELWPKCAMLITINNIYNVYSPRGFRG